MCSPDNKALTVTVFTPTYNRGQTLERLYRSLKKQTFTNFEWLIIDDGSTDNTEAIVRNWIKENKSFEIRYFWKPNGGKHTAHNYALTKARGEYFAIIDSDDWYSDDALTILVKEWEKISEEKKARFSNIEGQCCYNDGTLIGTPWPKSIFDVSGLEVKKFRKDTRGMYRLSVLKKFPFPDCFDGVFVPEGLVWNRIAEKYLTRFINKVVGYADYQQNGLTNRSLKERLASSEPAILYYRELSSIKSESAFTKLTSKVNVYRYTFHCRLSISKEFKREKHKTLCITFMGFGYITYLKDRIRLANERLSKSA